MNAFRMGARKKIAWVNLQFQHPDRVIDMGLFEELIPTKGLLLNIHLQYLLVFVWNV